MFALPLPQRCVALVSPAGRKADVQTPYASLRLRSPLLSSPHLSSPLRSYQLQTDLIWGARLSLLNGWVSSDWGTLNLNTDRRTAPQLRRTSRHSHSRELIFRFTRTRTSWLIGRLNLKRYQRMLTSKCFEFYSMCFESGALLCWAFEIRVDVQVEAELEHWKWEIHVRNSARCIWAVACARCPHLLDCEKFQLVPSYISSLKDREKVVTKIFIACLSRIKKFRMLCSIAPFVWYMLCFKV